MELIEFKNIILPMKNQLFRYAKRFLNNHEEAEDVIQEAFISIWQKLESVRDNPEPFVWRIVRNSCIDKLRSKHIKYKNVDFDDLEFEIKTDTIEPDKLLESKDINEIIQIIINSMPAKWIELFHLREIEGLSHAEISDLLSISESSVKTSLCRIRKHIKETLINKYSYEYQR
jgi:RNA polymerase sigma-70 factor (ECF subfamily)